MGNWKVYYRKDEDVEEEPEVVGQLAGGDLYAAEVWEVLPETFEPQEAQEKAKELREQGYHAYIGL